MSAAARQRREQRIQKEGEAAAKAVENCPVLALPGPLMPPLDLYGDGSGAALTVGDPAVRLLLSRPNDTALDRERHTIQTASSVWDCAVALARFLHRNPANLGEVTRVLELGAGTGLVSIAAMRLLEQRAGGGGAEVVITDVPAVLPAIEANLLLNRPLGVGVRARASALDWLDIPSHVKGLDCPYDVVLAADVVWVVDLIRPFVR